MPHNQLLQQIENWHAERSHTQIIKTILALPKPQQTAQLTCLLARALLNEDKFEEALSALNSIQAEYGNNPYFCVRYALALYPLHREDEALLWFKKAQQLGLEQIDETPGTYLPKSVAKWIERAEIWAPRRTEKRALEAKLRANRQTKAAAALPDAVLDSLWNDCAYSLQSYVGTPATDAEIAAIEAELGYRLPAAYKALVKTHNGGILAKTQFKNPLQRVWAPRVFSIDCIYGTDREKANSLCGSHGSPFWVTEWGYPDIGVAIGSTPSGGHEMIFLDYTDCGPTGEPCVVYVDQESDYEQTYLADHFADFMQGLFVADEEEE